MKFAKYSDTTSNVLDTFVKVTEYFFENFYNRNDAAITLRVAKRQFKNHLSPLLVLIRRIVPKKCQALFAG